MIFASAVVLTRKVRTPSPPDFYIVDGGVQRERTFDATYLLGPCNFSGSTGIGVDSCGQSYLYSSIGNPQLTPEVTTQELQNGFRRGVWHEKSFHSAFGQMLKNSRNYYDLEVEVPPADLGLQFDILLRKLSGGTRSKVEAYSEVAGVRRTELKLAIRQQ